jgi:SprT-like protein
MTITMNNEELQRWVERVSLESFKRPFKHLATFNGRLKATGGRYQLQSRSRHNGQSYR